MGITHVIMEVSSHALDQYRVADVEFNVGAFTNLSEEHLDYHKSMKNYFDTKAKLFQMLSASSSAVINYDDELGLKISKASKAKLLTFSKQRNTNFHLSGLINSLNGIEFILNHESGKIPISSSLIGEYNVENILCAVSIALSQNINPKIIQKLSLIHI